MISVGVQRTRSHMLGEILLLFGWDLPAQHETSERFLVKSCSTRLVCERLPWDQRTLPGAWSLEQVKDRLPDQVKKRWSLKV